MRHPNYGAGWREHSLYTTWAGMVQRCTNPKHSKFHRYGGRGISVCERWRRSFGDFLTDMGERPSPKHSIDRKDNDGNYEPGNCRWATGEEQCRNRIQNVLLTIDGVTLCASDWALRAGVPVYTVLRRKGRGLSDPQCVAPSQRPGRPSRKTTLAIEVAS